MHLRKLGIIETLLSGVTFGFLGYFGKVAFEQGLTPGELLSFRFLIGGLILWIYTYFKNPLSLKLSRKEYLTCAGLGIFGYAVFSSCFFMALQGLSASLTVLLLYTYPVLVAGGAWILFKEKIPAEKFLALPLVMLGLMALIWGDFEVKNFWFLLFGFGSAFFYSLYILASSRLLEKIDAYASVVFIQLAAGITLFLIHFQSLERSSQIFLQSWPTLLGAGVLCSAIAMSLFIAGLKKLKSWEVSILSTAEPVTGVLVAIFFLKESLTTLQIIGTLLVLLGLVWVSKPTKT